MEWCCWGGLNSRPQPYQGCALPLSYSSTPFRLGPQRVRAPGQGALLPWGLALSSDWLDSRGRLRMPEKPPLTPREQRLAAALRENLKRRKAQARAGEALQTLPKDNQTS